MKEIIVKIIENIVVGIYLIYKITLVVMVFDYIITGFKDK